MVEREPRLLTDHCREVNTFGRTLLSYASEFGHTAIVAALLEVDPSVEHVRMATNNGDTGLTLAASKGHTDVVRALLEVDSSVEHVRMATNNGDTGLIIASREGRVDIVRALLQVDQAVEHVRMASNIGDTGLALAALKGHTDVVRALLEVDPSVEHVRTVNNTGDTGLILAAWKGHTDAVRALLEVDPSMEHVQMATTKGTTAIHLAAQFGQHACMSLLLETGADVNATANSGRSPLYLACYAIMTAAEQFGTQDGRMNNSDDPTRCLVLLLQSRKLTMRNITRTIIRLRRNMPSKQQVAEAEAGGEPLTIVHKGARLAVPVLEAELRGERRWCAGCRRLTPDQNLDICTGCRQVGYCVPPTEEQQHWMYHEERDRVLAMKCRKKKGGHKKDCKRWAKEAAAAEAAAEAAGVGGAAGAAGGGRGEG
jgi:ankyrin repeat protein